MASARSDIQGGPAAAVPAFTAHKILVAGGFGAGVHGMGGYHAARLALAGY
jgi:hypothetical protein